MPPTIIGNVYDLNHTQETWFIQNVLFSGSTVHIGYDSNLVNNQAVIYLELNEISGELIKHLKLAKNKVILYHMGDEHGKMSRLQYQNCDLIIRNYYFEGACQLHGGKEVLWAPCGFKNGVGPRPRDHIKSAGRRQWLASFLGWIKNPNSFNNERTEFSQIASSCGEDLFFLPSSEFSSGWNVGLYSIGMESSIFAPCPAGNNPETIRLYDALELGCIPISLSHDFLQSKDALAMFGDVPFPILGSWSELPQFLEEMKLKCISSPNEILELQNCCIDWWSNFKIALQQKIAARIQAL